jgi:4-amino-4-deoxy-L-arabinose transferase-like glycosyltransferase
MTGFTGPRLKLACMVVLLGSLAVLVPTTADFGLTYDEPAYRHSQEMSQQWWEQLGPGLARFVRDRDRSALDSILTADALLYYWPYGRYGINFHPPLAGQANLLTYRALGSMLRDIPARRMASVIEFAVAVTLLFGFLASRYGLTVGLVAAGSLLTMPRLYGQAHLIDTDTLGLLLWIAAVICFWKGLHERNARKWRVLVGVLVGLAFVEKMAAVFVVLPILAWLLCARLPKAFRGDDRRFAWIDGLFTSTLMLAPLGIAYSEIRRLSGVFLIMQAARGVPPEAISPAGTDLFRDRPQTELAGWILLAPLAVWLIRRILGVLFRKNLMWGRIRPGLEIWTSILAFAPAVAWVGNPAWWREALPRLAHYYAISTTRRGVLPDIQILYFGQTYEYSLPWHNAWVLLAITVPAATLIAAIFGLLFAIGVVTRDRIPLFFLMNLAVLPMARMLPTPAHDGVRLFLPTFLFVAALAGWGVAGVSEVLARKKPQVGARLRVVLAAAVLVSSAWQLARVHPYELSYYNELIGGPRGAWNAGFELSYWYDALNGPVLRELNRGLPRGASIEFANEMSKPVMVVSDLQALGDLRGDIVLGARSHREFPFMWLLTHDSKADGFTRLLFAMKPWLAREPRALSGLRVFSVADPEAVSRAWALQYLLDAPDRRRPDPPQAPAWVRENAPILARFWGDGITKSARLTVNAPLFDWAKGDPEGLRAAARGLSQWKPAEDASQAWTELSQRPDPERRLVGFASWPPMRGNQPVPPLFRLRILLWARPQALVEATEILISRPDAVRRVLTRYGYTDMNAVGGHLDRDLVTR